MAPVISSARYPLIFRPTHRQNSKLSSVNGATVYRAESICACARPLHPAIKRCPHLFISGILGASNVMLLRIILNLGIRAMADDARSLLKVACDNAYDKNPTSCSHAVWDVIRSRVNQQEPHRQANALIKYLADNWEKVALDDGYTLALKGTVVVGGLVGEPNGHVIAVYPSDKTESGGYAYEYYDKKKKATITLTMRTHGKYPTCMSTSIGSWPGAISKGDKTVWDPWANDETFAKVKFWTPKAGKP
jgi:hypothetical protein